MAAAHTCTRRDGTAVGIKTSIRLWAKARAGGNWIGGRGVEGPGVCCFAESLVPSWKGTIGCAMRIGTDGPPRRSLPAGTTFLPAPCPPPSGPNSLPVLTLLRLDFFFSSSCSSTPAPLFFFFSSPRTLANHAARAWSRPQPRPQTRKPPPDPAATSSTSRCGLGRPDSSSLDSTACAGPGSHRAWCPCNLSPLAPNLESFASRLPRAMKPARRPEPACTAINRLAPDQPTRLTPAARARFDSFHLLRPGRSAFPACGASDPRPRSPI